MKYLAGILILLTLIVGTSACVASSVLAATPTTKPAATTTKPPVTTAKAPLAVQTPRPMPPTPANKTGGTTTLGWIGIVMGMILWCINVALCYYLARQRERNATGWASLALFFGPVPTIALLTVPLPKRV